MPATDDLEQFVRERTKRNPKFPDMVRAAEQRQALARQLAKLRSAVMTQTELAAVMKTSAAVISRVENGADVRISTLQKYAAALNKDLRVELAPRSMRAKRAA